MSHVVKQIRPMSGEAQAIYKAWGEAQQLLCRCASGCDCGNEEARAQAQAFYEAWRDEAFSWLRRNAEALMATIPINPPPNGYSSWNMPVSNGVVRVTGSQEGYCVGFEEMERDDD